MLFTVKSFLGIMALLVIVVTLYKDAGDTLRKIEEYANPLEWFTISITAFWLDLFLAAGFLFLVSQLSFHENCQYELIRMGKRRWLKQQFLSIVLTAVLYLSWFMLCITIALRHVRFSSHWSEFIEYADQLDLGYIGIGVGGGHVHAAGMLKMASPISCFLVHFLLFAACLSFLGILSFVINLHFNKNAGSIAVMAILLVYGLITLSGYSSFALRVLDAVHPLMVAQVTSKYSDMPWQQSLLYGMFYFGVGTLLLWVIGKNLVKKIDFTK